MTREEALKIVRENYPHFGTTEPWLDLEIALATLIPELAESEDERIRKAIVGLIEELQRSDKHFAGVELTDMLTYLEKQKEEDGVEFIPIENTLEYKVGQHSGFLKGLEEGRKQKEQKPAEWSEEDEDNLERIINYLWMLDSYVGDDCSVPQGKTDKIRNNIPILSSWLKSLRPRLTKSDEK